MEDFAATVLDYIEHQRYHTDLLRDVLCTCTCKCNTA